MNLFECDDAFGDDFVERWQERRDAFGSIDDFDHDRHVFRKVQNLHRVDAAAGAEAFDGRRAVAPARPCSRAARTIVS